MTSYIAKVPLDKVDIQAMWGLQESQVSMGAKVGSINGRCSSTILITIIITVFFLPEETMLPNSRQSEMASFPKELTKSILLSVKQPLI